MHQYNAKSVSGYSHHALSEFLSLSLRERVGQTSERTLRNSPHPRTGESSLLLLSLEITLSTFTSIRENGKMIERSRLCALSGNNYIREAFFFLFRSS